MLLAAAALAALTGSTLAQSDYPAQAITTIGRSARRRG
jgi:hypothetical protein